MLDQPPHPGPTASGPASPQTLAEQAIWPFPEQALPFEGRVAADPTAAVEMAVVEIAAVEMAAFEIAAGAVVFNQATAPLKHHHSAAGSPGRGARQERGQAVPAIKPMTPSAVDTGSTATNPLGWSALDWDSGQLLTAQNTTITYFSPTTFAVSKTTTITESATGIPGLIDGLD